MVRQRVKPLMYTRMRLGEFDPPSMNPYDSISMSVVQSAAHQKLALLAAMKSFVLLKNEPYKNSREMTLPLRKKYKKVAVSFLNCDLLLRWNNGFSNLYFVLKAISIVLALIMH